MNNEIFLYIAAYFFISGVLTALLSGDGYKNWKKIPMHDMPFIGFIYFLDCFFFDVFVVLYIYTQWGTA